MALRSIVIVLVLLAAAVGLQYISDLHAVHFANRSLPVDRAMVHVFNLGLRSATASYLWMTNIVELPFFQNGRDTFFANFDTLTSLDPKFSFPYSFTALVLPVARYPGNIDDAISIGLRGMANADPDWRIPFYLAATYQLDKGDFKHAVEFYTKTAETPGVPDLIKKFSEGFGTSPRLRAETRRVWAAIAEALSEGYQKDRAKAYVMRLDLFDQLETIARGYKARTGKYPMSVNELIAKKVIPSNVRDPLGMPLYFNQFGEITLNASSAGR